MNISLPEQLKRFVDAKVASGMYGSASEFVREAIREKMKHEEELENAKAKLTAELLTALEQGGESIEFDDDYIPRKKREFEARVRELKRSA